MRDLGPAQECLSRRCRRLRGQRSEANRAHLPGRCSSRYGQNEREDDRDSRHQTPIAMMRPQPVRFPLCLLAFNTNELILGDAELSFMAGNGAGARTTEVAAGSANGDAG